MYPAVAFAMGIALAIWIFPIDLLFGLPEYWDKVSGDNAANWIGYEAFARDAWHWPLFTTKLLAPPEGVNILFADPIPGLALLGKIIFKLTGRLPNYFGPWLLIAYALQPTAAYLILRKLSLSKFSAFIGSLAFLLVPTFIFRYGHFPLLSHWIILVALLFYFSITRNGRRKVLIGGAAFTLSVILINPYLLMMTIAIYCAALFDSTLRGKITPVEAGAVCSGLALSVIGAALMFGFVQFDKPSSAGGFGMYSMNLLSPIVPQLSSWPGHENLIIQGVPGQYEGYNYLGLGTLSIIVAAIIIAWRSVWEFVKRSPALIIAAGLMSIYALSNRIYAGNVLLVEVPLYDFVPMSKLAGVFRSSGRFFWPMSYILLIIGLYALYTRLGTRKFAGIAALALAVQAADIQPLIGSVRERAIEKGTEFDRNIWQSIAKAHDEILVLPQFLCMNPEGRKSAYALGVLASSLGIPTNSAIINRSDIDCAAEKVASIKNLKGLATGTTPLIFVLKRDFSSALTLAASQEENLTCRDVGPAYACSSQTTLIADLGTELPADQGTFLGQKLTVHSNGDGLSYLAAGWSEPGESGVWGVGNESVFHVPLNQEACHDLELTATVTPYSYKEHNVDTGMLFVGSDLVGPVSVKGPGKQTISARIPISKCVRSLTFSVKFSNLKSPRELGASNDSRRLSWAWLSFALNQIPK